MPKKLDSNTYALVIDDHPLVARGFADYLASQCGFNRVLTAADSSQAMDHIEINGQPSLAVLDFWLAGGGALSVLRDIRDACETTRILVVSGDSSPLVQNKAREVGAHGFLHKQETPEIFARAVSTLRAGGNWFSSSPQPFNPATEAVLSTREFGLTERQGQVLNMMLRGLPNKRIALQLNISEQTVKEHVSGILEKLGARNRIELFSLLQGRPIKK